MRNSPIYSFPEPEKTSSWKPEDRGEQRIELVDHEYEAAKRRTELIRSRMSPPGALGLPPLLEAQRLKHGIPDGAFKSQAVFDRIFVFPIDAFDGEAAEKTAGGLYKPEVAKLKDMQEGHRGVLISAGLTACDRLMSHGIEIGHVVTTNKNVPFARRCEQLQNFSIFYLVMRDADLAGSETLMESIRAGERRVVDAGDLSAYNHQLAVNDNGTWVPKKKASVYVNDTW